MCKIKSVEYSSLRLLIDLLTSAVEQENLARSQDELLSRYAREFRAFSRNIDPELSAHPETFFIDLFSTAYTLLAKKSAKERETSQDLLFSDSAKFIIMVLAFNEEKNSGKRYVGKIDLKSNLLEQQAVVEEKHQMRAEPAATPREPKSARKAKVAVAATH